MVESLDDRATGPAGADRGLYGRYLSTTYAARNDLSPDGLRRAALAYRRELAPYLPSDREAAILEIGCGVGGFLRCCRELGYLQVQGIDASVEQIEFCRREGFDNVTCADALGYLRSSTGAFEAIVLSDVLEHIPKPKVIELLETIHDRLAPGGRVILRVPNLSNPLNLRTRYVDFTHECGFTCESLAQVLRLAGFEVETVHGAFQLHRRWWRRWLFDRLLWRLFQLFLRHTMHLKRAAVRGKNLIAVGRRADGEGHAEPPGRPG